MWTAIWKFGHWHLNILVLIWGEVPVLGEILAWCFSEWQRFAPED